MYIDPRAILDFLSSFEIIEDGTCSGQTSEEAKELKLRKRISEARSRIVIVNLIKFTYSK